MAFSLIILWSVVRGRNYLSTVGKFWGHLPRDEWLLQLHWVGYLVSQGLIDHSVVVDSIVLHNFYIICMLLEDGAEHLLGLIVWIFLAASNLVESLHISDRVLDRLRSHIAFVPHLLVLLGLRDWLGCHLLNGPCCELYTLDSGLVKLHRWHWVWISFKLTGVHYFARRLLLWGICLLGNTLIIGLEEESRLVRNLCFDRLLFRIWLFRWRLWRLQVLGLLFHF